LTSDERRFRQRKIETISLTIRAVTLSLPGTEVDQFNNFVNLHIYYPMP
jgi:hypothetical protein